MLSVGGSAATLVIDARPDKELGQPPIQLASGGAVDFVVIRGAGWDSFGRDANFELG